MKQNIRYLCTLESVRVCLILPALSEDVLVKPFEPKVELDAKIQEK